MTYDIGASLLGLVTPRLAAPLADAFLPTYECDTCVQPMAWEPDAAFERVARCETCGRRIHVRASADPDGHVRVHMLGHEVHS